MSLASCRNLSISIDSADEPEIREIVEARGINAHWAMMVEAREYRESLAMEHAAAHPEDDRESNMPTWPEEIVTAEGAS